MLNTHKLLYILPDVTYIAELLPGKKEHTFVIQSFRQINGEFLDEEENFITENIEKLFSKIEPETYHLILPDFLFTNTILDIKETNESKVKQYVKDTLLPQLDLSKDTHEIETFSLTQYNGSTKIQLTALEKSVLNSIVTSSQNHQITIEHISPLTWTIKSVISLEPSISVLQIGTLLYVAEHYIGVDQCTMSKVDELENVVDTIKTLKGSQPSIQTVYLLANTLVEEKIKEQVSQTLPVQQLAIFKEEDTQMPSYVKQIIESGMKTLDIPDFPVPSFVLPKHVQDVQPATKTESEAAETVIPLPAPISQPKEPAPEVSKTEVDEDLEPTKPETTATKVTITESITAEEKIETENTPLPKPNVPDSPLPTAIATTAAVNTITPAALIPAVAATASLNNSAPSSPAPIVGKTESLDDDSTTPIILPAKIDHSETETAEPKSAHSASSVIDDDSTIAKLAGHSDMNQGESLDETPAGLTSETETPTKRPVIKNQNGGNSLMKMAFVSLVVFALTVAIGIGIGYSILSLNNRSQSDVPAPVVSGSPAPSPVPSLSPIPIATTSATATGSASINKKTTKILVVNATTTPGYATTASKKLQEAGYTQVKAQNAKGTYDPGFYLLMTKQDPTALSTLSKDFGQTLIFGTGKATEDPSNQFDLVLVLGK